MQQLQLARRTGFVRPYATAYAASLGAIICGKPMPRGRASVNPSDPDDDSDIQETPILFSVTVATAAAVVVSGAPPRQ
jgi:hypothetical protein